MTDLSSGSVDEMRSALRDQSYLADRGLATIIHLSLAPANRAARGCSGRREVRGAKVLAPALGRKLIRLQCYEGIDAARPVCASLLS